MDINNILDVTSNKAATEYIRDRLVIIGEGTGNLISINGRTFVVTCQHVAKPFFTYNMPYIVLRDNVRVQTENLRLIYMTNEYLDIAVIEILSNINPRGIYNLNDFEIIEDFSQYNWKDTFCFSCGFPSGLAFRNELGYNYPYFSWTSSIHSQKTSDNTFLYLQYDRENEAVDVQSGLLTRIPEAKGLSGTFILKITKKILNKKQIWTPDVMKIIAIEQSWQKEEKYIKCTNIKHLFNILNNNKIII